MALIKTYGEIEKMRIVGKMAADCLETLVPMVKEGVLPIDIDRVCYEWTIARGAVPATLGYHGFPKSLCISVNEEVCHGIPDERPFQSGDIVNLDVTPKFDGFHGDTSTTVLVGEVKLKTRKLVEVTYQAMWEGIRQVKEGNTLGDIGHAIQKKAEANGYSVVLEYCGHGIGNVFHEEPTVVHVGKPHEGMKLKAGMIFTVEPMINMGGRKIYVDQNGWTVKTQDGSISAQFEHTVLVTKTGVEILTLRAEESREILS
jgi:methionyl aminopeptidase